MGINCIQMNRLVIVGNGFDLAHGLPTGYCDFMDNYWSQVFREFDSANMFNFNYSDDFISVSVIFSNMYEPNVLELFNKVNTYKEFRNIIETHRTSKRGTNNFDHKFKFKNHFFSLIHNEYNLKNWVDIENEYYRLLKECLKYNDNTKVKKLNKEFEAVKNLLEKYLYEDVCEKVDFLKLKSEVGRIKDIFNIWNRYTESQNFSEEFPKTEQQDTAKYSDILKIYNRSGDSDISKFMKTHNKEIQNLFLNFNYTPTIDYYMSDLVNDDMNYYGNSVNLQIHGRLNDNKNKINFGFGDEMDNHYKLIEEKNDNEYLKNIKSFQYLQNSNYKKLLDFIESKKFQVYVMGHSCGLSDRILLNTIFEHENCKSIKVFYYENEIYDNYTEIIQNISRHFNKKKLMREKIVNKTLCQSLPQMKLPLKENSPQM